MEKILQKMLSYLEDPWSSISPIEPILDRIETNPQFTQIVSPSEMVVIVSLETKINDVLGMINICIPFLVLEPIINKLSVHFYYSSTSRQREHENTEVIQNRLQDTVLPLKVLLGRTVITVADLLELNVGDVLPLDRTIHDDLDIMIGQRTKYWGKPGIYKTRIAVQVSKVLEEDEEDE
jgi:flagellar motor switch protein FliM